MTTKHLLYSLTLLLLAGVFLPAHGQTKEAATFNIPITRVGASAEEAQSNLTLALGYFALTLAGDADIYERDADGTILLDEKGIAKFDRSKIEKRLFSFFENQADAAEIAAKAAIRKAAAVAQIDEEERDAIKGRKPAKEAAAPGGGRNN